jgi:hypothetical protein
MGGNRDNVPLASQHEIGDWLWIYLSECILGSPNEEASCKQSD